MTVIGSHAKAALSNSLILGGTGIWASNVAVGTSTPFAKFSIQGNLGSTTALFDIASTTSGSYATTSLFNVQASGVVAIGTTSPTALKLDIADATYTAAASSALNLRLYSDGAGSSGAYGGINIDNTLGGNAYRSRYGVYANSIQYGVIGRTTGDGNSLMDFVSGWFPTPPSGLTGIHAGTSGGNAINGVSYTVTSSNMMELIQAQSTFSGVGLKMDFATNGGSFTGKYLSFLNGDVEKFAVDSTGAYTATAGTTTSATTTNLKVSTIRDNSGSVGTNGMVLLSNGSTVAWVATSTLGLGGAGSSNWVDNGAYLSTLGAGDGIIVSGSSTIGDGTAIGGLTINGNATTTGTLLVQGTATSTINGPLNVNAYGSGGQYGLTVYGGSADPLGGRLRIASNDSIVSQGDILGALEFYSIDGTAGSSGTVGQIHTTADDNFSGTFGRGSSMIFSIASSTNLNEAMRITNKVGNTYYDTPHVGIGSTSPSRLLTVGGDGYFLGNITAASSTLAYASSTALTVSGNSYFNFASSTNASTTGLTASNAYILNNLGIGTTTPTARFALTGTAGQTASLFRLSSSTESILFDVLADGSVDIGQGGIYYNASTDETTIANLNIGATSFETDAGAITWVNMDASSTPLGNVLSYTAKLDGNDVFTVYGESDGAGGVQNLRVGIGSSTPTSQLSVTGTARADIFNAASSSPLAGYYLNGLPAVIASTTLGNYYFANASSSKSTVNSQYNYAMGQYALANLTTGDYNFAVGKESLYGSSTVGMTGSSNNALGYQALFSNTSGESNNAFGEHSLYLNTIGSYNNAMGLYSLSNNTTGSSNNALGQNTLTNNTTGSHNNAFSEAALTNNTTGSYNNAFGEAALSNNTTGSYNSAIGYQAGFFLDNGIATSSGNLFLGYQAGFNQTQGDNNILIGYNVNVASTTGSNQLSLGNLIYANGLGQGDTVSSGNVSVGTSTPWAKFSLQNNFASTTVLFDIATTTSAGYATSSLFRVDHTGQVSLGSSTPESLLLTLQKTGITGAGVFGIKEYLGFQNSIQNAVYYGDNAYIVNAPTATSTLIGKIIRIEDSTSLGNTVRGLEVQAHKGTNTKGENTGISAYGRTFGLRGTTEADAGDTYLPAGVFAETRGTTQGNALRAYSGSITTSNLAYLFQDTSAFSGTGLLMNFGNSGGSFAATSSGKFIDLQVGGTSKFYVAANGSTTIGDGTVNASLRIPFGGICVDNDGSCVSTTTGQIRSVTSALGNSDLAEMYFSSDTLTTGEIVSLTGGLSVGRATGADTENIIGVVSTKPGMTLGFDDTSLVPGEQGYPVGLKGRVPVLLSTENGPIVKGDRITISSVPGVGMKATESSTVVGIALEDYTGETAYSEGFLNQFGDDLVKERITLKRNTDPRTDNGCYEGGGVAQGEKPCTPDKVKAQKALVISIDERTETLRTLSLEEATTTTLENGEEVQIGQAIMFIELTHYTIPSETEILAELNSTTSLLSGNGTETLFDRLKTLANSFVDGVLTLAEVVADKFTAEEVNTNMLCIGETCVDEATLKALLQAQGQGAVTPVDPTPEPEPQPPVEDPGSGGTGENPPADGGTEPTPPVVEETPAPEVVPTPEVTPEPTPEPAPIAEATPFGEPSI